MKTSTSTGCGPPSVAIVGDSFNGPAERLLNTVLRHYNIEPTLTTDLEGAELVERLTQLNPDVIVALGKTAIEDVMGEKVNVTSIRSGPPKKSKHFDAQIIPTYHPGMAIRNTGVFPDIIADFGKINTPVVEWKEPSYTVVTTVEMAKEVIMHFAREEILVLDIEVGVEKDQDFSHPDVLLCVGMASAQNDVYVLSEEVCDDGAVRSHLDMLISTHRGIVCHNGKFDLQVLNRLGIGDHGTELFFDTMLASYALDERQGVHGLKYLSAELLGAPAYDMEVKEFISGGQSFANIPRDLLYKYNAYDVALTYELYLHYVVKLAEEGLRNLHDELVWFSNGLMQLELVGVSVDMNYLEELEETYLDGLADVEKKLSKWVENPRSPKQVKEALFSLGVTTESTNVEVLNNILESASKPALVEFVSLMLHHRKEQKLYGTYVKGTRQRLIGEKVYPTFLLHGTVTGRLACRNPNLQNVPRESKIRKLFVPSEGNIFVQADYAQAELRVITCLAKDEYLRGVFNDNRDLHSEIAERFFGPNFTKDERVRAKAVVFGLAYGREAYSLSKEFKIPVAEAERYVDTFFEAIPQVVQWRAEIKERVLHRSETLETPFGRRRRFWLITPENQKDVLNEAYGFLPQSIASDLTMISMMEMLREFEDGIAEVKLPVHDSVLVECKPEHANMVASKMTKIMERTAKTAFSDYVPFTADAEIGNSWGELKDA